MVWNKGLLFKAWGNFKISYFFGLPITYEDKLLDYYNSGNIL